MGFKSLKNFPQKRTGIIANFINGKGLGFSGHDTGSESIYELGTISATGGSTFTSDGKKIHVFTSTGPFSVTSMQNGANAVEIEYILIAGGAGGGAGIGGGGGGGGMLVGTYILPKNSVPGNFTFTVGSGGAAATVPGGEVSGGNGNNSSAFGVVAYGGGGGKSDSGNGIPGGSGGGGGWSSTEGGFGYNPTTPQPVLNGVPLPFPYTETQGAPGGTSTPGTYNSGGGGGGGPQGTPGENASPAYVSGPGGNGSGVTWPQLPPSYGTTNPTPSPGRWFAGGGGGGGTDQYGVTAGSGGIGGGGNGTSSTGAIAGTVNTGGGGGGGGNYSNPGINTPGANGGSGIVMVRYTPL